MLSYCYWEMPTVMATAGGINMCEVGMYSPAETRREHNDFLVFECSSFWWGNKFAAVVDFFFLLLLLLLVVVVCTVLFSKIIFCFVLFSLEAIHDTILLLVLLL